MARRSRTRAPSSSRTSGRRSGSPCSRDPHTLLPDETFDNKKTINLGGTTLELIYLGINHSDSNIVMPLPKEKLIFLVDTIPVGTFPGRGFIDIYPLETEDFIKKVIALDWERMIPGHPGGRLGSKKDAQDVLTLMQEASAEIKRLAQEGKSWEPVEKEFKLPKYATLPGYENGLPMVARRYCGLGGAAPELGRRLNRSENSCRRSARRHLSCGGPPLRV